MSAWWVLLAAGLLETVWALGLPYTEGFRRPGPTVVVLAAMTASVLLLANAVRTLPLGTAYAMWVGIGVLGAVAGGVLLFEESLPPARVAFVALLVVALAGLKMTAPAA